MNDAHTCVTFLGDTREGVVEESYYYPKVLLRVCWVELGYSSSEASDQGTRKMPDTAGLGQRPVVRRVSATHNDLITKFEQRRPSQSSLSSGVVSPSLSGTSTPLTTERYTTPLPTTTKVRTGSTKTKITRSKAEVSCSPIPTMYIPNHERQFARFPSPVLL